MSNKSQKITISITDRLMHIPNPMHLDACKQGSRITRNKKKYTRKGKQKFDLRKYSI